MTECYFQTENASLRVGGALNIRFTPSDQFAGAQRGVYSTDRDNEIVLLRGMANDRRSGIIEISKDVYHTKVKSVAPAPPPAATNGKRVEKQKPAPPVAKDKTFYTCGNLGDIIYCLPTMRAMQDGVLLIGPKQTCGKAPTRAPMTREMFDIIAPLLRRQPYLKRVEWVDEPGTVHWDFNQFRLTYHDRTRNLAYAMLNHAGLPDFHADRAWLHLDRQSGEWPKVIINRSPRYQNPDFDWKGIVKQFGKESVFVGLKTEYEAFCRDFGRIEYRPTKDLLEAAMLLRNAQLFIGNQSCIRAIAEGFKMPVIVEESPKFPDTRFIRPDASYGMIPAKLPVSLKATALITISLLCYNRLDLTEACLASVLQHSPNAQIIVSNNASWDGTAEYLEGLKKSHPNLTVLHNEGNIGFGPAHNRAFQRCQTPYFLVMNNDIVVCPGWIETLVAPLERNPMMAQVGLNNTCTKLNNDFEGTPGPPHEYCEGSLTMVRAEAIRALPDGLFAEYVRFIYGEDSDLSLRLQESGWKIEHIALPIKHAHSSTITGLPLRTKQFIRRVKAANHAFLKDRWTPYLRKRRFDYSVLLQRKGARGDVLLLTPIIHALKRKWPNSHIQVETQFPEIFARNPDVAGAFSGGSERMAFDFVYKLDMAYEGDRRRHILDCYAEACDLDPSYLVDRRPRVFPSPNDFESIKLPKGQKYACIHPGPTTWAGKNWPQERWKAVVQFLEKNGYHPCVIGGSGTFHLDGATSFTGNISVHQNAAVLSHASLLIGLDSFPAHLAQAMRVPTIVLFGETRPECLFHPEDFHAVCADTKDAPCAGEHFRAREIRTSSKCDGACMKSIHENKVINTIEKLIDRIEKSA